MDDHTYLIVVYILIGIFLAFILGMIIYSGIMMNDKKEEKYKNLNTMLMVSNILLFVSILFHYCTRPLRTKGSDFKTMSTISLIFILVSFLVTLGFAIYFSKSMDDKKHPSLILLYVTLAFYLPILGQIITRFMNIKNLGNVEESSSDSVENFIQNDRPTYGFRRSVARGRKGRW